MQMRQRTSCRWSTRSLTWRCYSWQQQQKLFWLCCLKASQQWLVVCQCRIKADGLSCWKSRVLQVHDILCSTFKKNLSTRVRITRLAVSTSGIAVAKENVLYTWFLFFFSTCCRWPKRWHKFLLPQIFWDNNITKLSRWLSGVVVESI